MAVYPCARAGHRYPQAQQTVYATRLNGAGVTTHRLRLCPRHFSAIVEVAEENMTLVDEAMQSNLVCERCDLPKQDTLFLRVFELKQEERQYCSDLCAAHARVLADMLGTGDGEPMGGR